MCQAADSKAGFNKNYRLGPIPALAAVTAALWLVVLPAAGKFRPACPVEIERLAVEAPASAAVPAAQIDSFYLKRLQEGVKAYEDARFAEAFKALEIAMFGLAGDKTKLAECLTFAGLSAHQLKNVAKSREYILRAKALLETPEVKPPAWNDKDRGLFEKLQAEFASTAGAAPDRKTAAPAWTAPASKAPAIPAPVVKSPQEKPRPAEASSAKTPDAKKPAAAPQTQKPTAQKPPVQRPPAETSRQRPAVASPPPASSPKPETSPIASLEKRLQADPGNAALTFELAGAYLEGGNPAKARQLLEPYLVKKPEDYGAAFLLAKADFGLRRFKAAFSGFHALSSPRIQAELPPDTALKIGIYRALCLYRQGDRVNLPSAYAMVSAGVAPEALEKAIASEGLTADWAALQKALGR